MDETDPDILIDKNGICNYCHTAKLRIKPTDSPLAKIKKAGEGKMYDCLIGLSGGVDSSLVAHYVMQLGLNPLAVRLDNGWDTDVAKSNISNLIKKLDIDCLHLQLQPEETKSYKELQVCFLAAGVINAEIPTDHVLGVLLYKTAMDNKIKYIISGGNYATEGTMPEAWSYSSKDLFHIQQIYKGFAGKKLKNLPTMNLLQYIYSRARVKTINLLDYYDYNQRVAKELLAKEYDWQDYGNKHCENAYTRWYQEYYLPNKFKIDKRKAHLSSLIQSGQMTREEAINELEKPLVNNDSPRVMAEFGISQNKFEKLMTLPPIPHKDYQNHEWLWRFASKMYRLIKK